MTHRPMLDQKTNNRLILLVPEGGLEPPAY